MEPAPVEPAPSEPASVEPAPVEPAPSEPAPVEPTPAEPAPSEPAPAKPAPSEPAPAKPAPAEPAPSEPAPVEPAAPDGHDDSGTPEHEEPEPEPEASQGTAASGRNRSTVFQVVWQVQQGCRTYCYGTSQSQSVAQWSSTTQTATAVSNGNQTAASGPGGSAAHAANESLTIQFAWQMQIGCVAFCYETSQVQTASQWAQTTQTAVAEAGLEAWAENLSETLQFVWQLQEGCAHECYGVSQYQSSQQGQSTNQSARATARGGGDGTMLALGPDGVIVLPGWLVALANNLGATIQTIYQYQEASCLDRCEGGAQIQEAAQRALVEQVAAAIAGAPPASEPPPGGTTPPAPQTPGRSTPAPAPTTAAARTAPGEPPVGPETRRQARLVAELLIEDLREAKLTQAGGGASFAATPVGGGLPPAPGADASSAPQGRPGDQSQAERNTSSAAPGSAASAGAFLGVEFRPALESLDEGDGGGWPSVILLALLAGLASVAVRGRAPQAR